MNKGVIGVGIIGCGFIANYHIWGYRNDPRVKVVGVNDVDEDKAKKFCGEYKISSHYSNYQKLLDVEDIRAVSICTPPHTHAEIAIAAAKKGKHILCEKPMCRSMEEGLQMIEHARNSKVKLMIGFITRFSSPFMRVKDLIKDGAIGKLAMISVVSWARPPWAEWFSDPKLSGLLFDRLCYGADYARWYAESEISEIHVFGNFFDNARREKYGPEYIDNAKITMKMENGVLASADDSFYVDCGGYYEKVEVAGTHGVMIADPTKNDMLTIYSARGGRKTFPFQGLAYPRGWGWFNFAIPDCFGVETKHFIDCILEDKEPSVTGEDGLRATEAILAGIESLKTGQTVKIKY